MDRSDASASAIASEPRRRSSTSRLRQAIRTLVVALVIGIAVGTVAIGSVGAAPTTDAAVSDGSASIAAESEDRPAIVVGDAALEPDGTGTQRVSLSDAPDGLAGFELTLAVGDGDVAAVANASYPEHFGLTTDPVVSADGTSITVEAVDLGDAVAPGAADVTLATIDVSGVDDGETDLRVTDLQVDADGGDPIEPSLEAGTLTVGDETDGTTSEPENEGSASGSAGSESNGDVDDSEASGSDDNDSETDDESDSTPGFAVGAAVAAIAVLVAAVRARLD